MTKYKKICFWGSAPQMDSKVIGLKSNRLILGKIFEEAEVPYEIVYDESPETIYLLNGETFVYLGIVTLKYSQKIYDWTVTQRNPDGSFPKELEKYEDVEWSTALICELNYNQFKGITPATYKKINKERLEKKQPFFDPGIIIHNYPYYSYGDQLHDACVNRCAKLLDGKYDIKKMMDEFPGVPGAVVLYKITKGERTGYAALWTDKIDRAHEFAKEGYKNYIPYCLDFSKKWPYSGRPFVFKAGEDFISIYRDYVYDGEKELRDKKEINQHIVYRIDKEFDDTYKMDENRGNSYLVLERAIKRAEQGESEGLDFYQFTDGRTKWKSEYLVYQIVKKMYPRDTIYQYAAPFLKIGKSQLVYDVFVASLNVAIEYQGEQHFKHVDFFGDEREFKARKRRDALKRKLSEENGVKLIYVNYDENVNEELIKAKISKALSVD